MQARPVCDWTKLHQTLYRFWVALGRPHDHAEEAAQIGTIQAWRNAHLWRGKASLMTYLVAVGKNAGRNFFRTEARQERKKRKMTETIQTVRRQYEYRRPNVAYEHVG